MTVKAVRWCGVRPMRSPGPKALRKGETRRNRRRRRLLFGQQAITADFDQGQGVRRRHLSVRQVQMQVANPGSAQEVNDFLQVFRLAVTLPGMVVTKHPQLGQEFHLFIGKGGEVDFDSHVIR